MTPRSGAVLLVGDVNTDVVVRASGPIAHASDTAAAIRVTGGGAAANTAAWLAGSGVPVTLVARVGDDPSGRERVAELAAAGVQCAIAVDKAAPTGTIVVLVEPDGERSMLADRGANALLTPDDVDAALAAAPTAAHLHLSGYCLFDEGSRAAGLHALAAARALGMTTSVDAASAAPLHALGPRTFLRWISGVDLLLANADEAAALTGGEIQGTAAAATALRTHARAVVIKCGSRGALWSAADQDAHIAAPDVTVVDTTGAGDAFAAGLLAAWRGGADAPTALRAGVAAGTECVATVGARPCH